MKRISNSITQKQLRTLAIKHGMSETAAVERIESPLIKVDSKGNLSCVICRTPLKSTSIWKVHVNSKAHKNNVQAAKELKTQILNTSSAPVNKAQTVQHKETKNPKLSHHKNLDIPSTITVLDTSTKFKATNTDTVGNPLPDAFFDNAATTTKTNADKDAEWELFQKEIKKVTEEAPNEIFMGDQKDFVVEKEIVEIDEQIQHWSKVLDMEEKRKALSGVIGNRCVRKHNESDGESSEAEEFEEYTDWRSKVFK